MIFRRLKFTTIYRYQKSLVHFDSLYKNVVSKCPIFTRIKYCESLIYRTKENMAISKCRVQKQKLKKLLISAKVELLKLKDESNTS